jgi:molybdate transport system regulatory protein
MYVKNRLILIDDEREPFMGPGPLWLLQGIREKHSIRQAALSIGMSYAKAHRIIRRLEKAADRKFCETTIGGEGGGSACLTGYALQFLEAYQVLERKVASYAESEFAEFLAKISNIERPR